MSNYNEVNYQLIGQRIKYNRKEKGYTQAVLAEKCSISEFYLSRIENGRVSGSLELYSVICNNLDIELGYLVSGTSRLDKTNYINELNEICTTATKEQLDLIINLAKVVLKK